MATKFNTVTETVTAIQFTFDVLKDIYLFLDMRDVSYVVKNRTLTGTVTDPNGIKLAVNKTDWIVKKCTFRRERMKVIFWHLEVRK